MIIVENISYRYPKSENDTINNMNFSIEKGEIYGFLGPSVAGKSTTQNILIKLLSGLTLVVMLNTVKHLNVIKMFKVY